MLSRKINLVTLILMTILIVGCSSGNGQSDKSSDKKTDSVDLENITIELATTLPYEEHKELLDSLESKLKDNSNGNASIEMFTDGTLGGESEILEQIGSGEINMGLGVLHSSLYYPQYDATSVPYLFDSYEDIFAYMDGPIGQIIDDILLEEANIIQLGYYKTGARWTTANKEIKSAEDFKGLKIRLSENPLHIDVFTGLNAVPTPMPSPDVFTALQTNVIDAQENMITNIAGRHFYEVQDYLIDTKHILSFATFLVNAEWWNNLGDMEKEVIENSITQSLEHGNEKMAEKEEEMIEYLTNEGNMQLVEPNIDDIRATIESGLDKVLEDNLAPEVIEELKESGIVK